MAARATTRYHTWARSIGPSWDVWLRSIHLLSVHHPGVFVPPQRARYSPFFLFTGKAYAMKNMKITAGLAFLLNTFLFATSYAVSKGTLARIDPIIFSFLVMMALVPVALGILAFSWSHLSREVVKSGFVLGSCLCLGLLMIYIALKYNSATSTAFYPSLNGFVAAVFAWCFLRHPI